MPAIRRRWTTAEVRALMDESRHWPRYELIDGELLVTPAPGVVHQIAVGELHLLLAPYVERESVGMTLLSPADLELSPGEITQPDVFVVPAERVSDDLGRWSDVKRLLLAVEVLSPSSVRNDRIAKRDYYMENGVAEYWIVDLDARFIERWRPGIETPAIERTSLCWNPPGANTGLEIDLDQFFGRIERKARSLGTP